MSPRHFQKGKKKKNSMTNQARWLYFETREQRNRYNGRGVLVLTYKYYHLFLYFTKKNIYANAGKVDTKMMINHLRMILSVTT